jgi:hypothetical protein
MKIRDDKNEHGVRITVFRCEFCGEEFSVCPAVPDINLDNWKGCLRPQCESYDEERDVDKMIEEGGVTLMKETKH